MPGATDEEVLISCHACHPSLANDNLSGVALAAYLARALAGTPHRYSYRFLFIPGTIGSITWLALNEDKVHRIRHGLVLALRGRRRPVHVQAVAGAAMPRSTVSPLTSWEPCRADTASSTSPPTATTSDSTARPASTSPSAASRGRRTDSFPEYHTSADDLDFVTPGRSRSRYALYLSIIDVLENNGRYRNPNPKCEPQLGRRGLYGPMGG